MREAVGLGADRSMDVGVALGLRGIEVWVTGSAPAKGVSHTEMRLVECVALEAAADPSKVINAAIKTSLDVATHELRSRR